MWQTLPMVILQILFLRTNELLKNLLAARLVGIFEQIALEKKKL